MVNYNNSKIYKIISNHTNKIFVGYTTEKYLSTKISKYKSNYNSWKNKGSTRVDSSFNILKFNDVKIMLIEKYIYTSKDELKARQQY